MNAIKGFLIELFDFFVGDVRALIGVVLAAIVISGITHIFKDNATAIIAGLLFMLLIGGVIAYTTARN